MKITCESSLWCFEFWSGAKCLREQLTPIEMDTIEEMLEELYPDGMTDTEINDLFWFDPEFVCELLGYQFIDGDVIRDSITEEEKVS